MIASLSNQLPSKLGAGLIFSMSGSSIFNLVFWRMRYLHLQHHLVRGPEETTRLATYLVPVQHADLLFSEIHGELAQ